MATLVKRATGQNAWRSILAWFDSAADNSRNNFLLALLTLGEGWHNNHHHYPVSVKQGFYWWEIDLTYYGLRAMSALGLVWDLKPVPVERRESNRLQPSRKRLFK